MITATTVAGWFHNFQAPEDYISEVEDGLSTREVSATASNALKLALRDRTANSRLSCRLGRQRETTVLNAYEHEFKRVVTKRNDTVYSLRIECGDRFVLVHGKIDGFDAANVAVVEHKRRTKRLLGFVPMHENVQCHIYMRMLKCSKTHLVESFGAQMRVHTILFDSSIWESIVQMVGQRG